MTYQSRKPPTTTPSTGVTVRQRVGIRRCIRRPSSRSSRHSASSAITVDVIASRMATSLSVVGCDVKRVSIVADNDRPGGAGPLRSVNTPTMAGRRLGSG